MKRTIVMVLSVLMLCTMSVSALAYGEGTYDIATTSTTDFIDGCPNSAYRNTGANWEILIACGNVASNHRFVMKIKSGENTASSTWVYSKDSGNSHPYKVAYQGAGHLVRVWGRLDNRDSGHIEAAGPFYY